MISLELKQEIGKLITDATAKDAQSGLRTDLFDRYMAEPYGDEVEGRSKYLDTTSSDAVEAILADIMDVYTSTPRLMDMEPTGPEDEEAAEQEADVMSHLFWKKNSGFENLYTWVKEALIQQNAYVWSGWVEKERVEIEEYEDLTDVEFYGIIEQLEGDYEILEQSGFETIKDKETGEESTYQTIGDDGMPAPISVKIRCVKKSKEYVIEPFPQEEFFGTPRWNKVSLEGIKCHGRVRDMNEAELLAMDFSQESIDKACSGSRDDEQKASRHSTADSAEEEADDSTAMVYETYVLIDLNDDGKNCLVKAWMYGDGGECFEMADGSEAIEEVTHGQISALTPYIIPHRHIGRSMVELVDDIQKVQTVLMRQLLDNTYLTNYGRPHFDENNAGPNTFADLAAPGPGKPVRTGGAEVVYNVPPSIAPAVLPLLEKFEGRSEQRTGATRYNQGLDAESLNKTMGGMQMIMNASQKKTKLIARTLAETGIKDLFIRMHADLRAGPVKKTALKLRGKWVDVDPRTWKHRTDMTPTIGMGRGDRDEVRAGLSMLGQVQRELRMAGSRMATDQNVYNTVSRVAETFGITHLDPFLTDPSQIPPEPPKAPPPDPIMENVKAQASKNEADAQRDAAKLAADERERVRQHDLAMQKLKLEELKLTNTIRGDEDKQDLAEKKVVMDDDFKRDKLEIDAATAHMRDVAKAVTSTPPVSYESVTE